MTLIEEIRELQKDKPGAGYLDARPDLADVMKKLSENTVVHNEDKWADLIRDNWEKMKECGSFACYEGFGRDKTCIIVGASPALKRNVEDLKRIEGEFRDRFIIVAVNSVAEFLISKGIVPDFIVAVDCDEEVWTRDISKINGVDSTLLCSPFIWPEIPRKWKSKLYFIPMGCSDEKVQEDTKNLLGAERIVPGAGNAFNQSIYIMWHVFHCKNYILVGSELSWPKDEKYYVDGKHSNDEEDDGIHKIKAIDIWGKEVITTPGHWVFKLWIEQLASVANGVFINATEGGILGISPKDGVLPFIKQFYLGKAIEYINGIYESSKDWHFMEAMKYNLAWLKGYDCRGIPNPSMVKSVNPKTVLDVGCGGGSSVEELTKLGYDAYGIDISNIAADKWNGVGSRCYLAFADNIPTADDYFDLAMTDILEHQPVDAVGATIKEIARVSKKQMFNVEFGEARWLIDGRIEPHTTQKPREWWQKEFKRNGLEIVATSGERTFLTKKRENK